MEADLISQLCRQGYQLAYTGADLISPDGREVYEIKLGARGVRDLRDAVIGLATYLSEHSDIEYGNLLAELGRISADRVKWEWHQIEHVLVPRIRKRMRLFAVVDGEEIVEPTNSPRPEFFDRFAELARQRLASDRMRHSIESDRIPIAIRPKVSWKHLEIEKILVYRWLANMRPIGVGVLSEQVGCSYPTTIQAIRRMSADNLIARNRHRTVALARYPRERWTELFRTQRLAYPPDEFIDPTNTPETVKFLITRLNRSRPKDAAMGGVLAARKWDPQFDLNGTPRIDVVLHTPMESSQHDSVSALNTSNFVHQLDPALKRKTPQTIGTKVLVIHRTNRQDSLFIDEPPSPVPWANPVEVLFQLNEMGLTPQADHLVRHFRGEAKS
jgi:Mn-dependent DtxR family transcriptional regulator